MPKTVTLKDVIYALEYGGEELVGKQDKIGSPVRYALSKSGLSVAISVVDQFRLNPNCERRGLDGIRYGWRPLSPTSGAA
jgi:hypothetical protein